MDEQRSPSDYELAVLREMFTGRRGRLRIYLFEIAAALGYMLVAVAFLLAPTATSLHSPIGHPVYPFDRIWSVLYLVGGAGILFGVLHPMLRIRAAGMILLGTALIMQCVAAASFRFDFRIGFYLIFAAACWLRAWLIVSLFRRYQGFRDDTPAP